MEQREHERFFNGIEALSGDLFAYAFSITKSKEDAEDAVHNAIIKAFDGLSKLRNFAKFKPWLLTILRNECLILLRQRKRFAPLDSEMPAGDTSGEEDLDIANSIGELEDELREAVMLYYKLGYSTAEIAGIVGIPRSTVMSRLARARELIRKQLEGEKR